MTKIATLGPPGTFSYIATWKYIKEKNLPSIQTEVLESNNFPGVVSQLLNSAIDLGILPIENTLDGYVNITLDLLLKSDIRIVDEILLPIQFSFVNTVDKLEDVNKIYVQFKTQGQCTEFLSQFPQEKIITTQTNGISIQEIKKRIEGDAAIIPTPVLNSSIVPPSKFARMEKENYAKVDNDVTDETNNQTRFIVLSKNPAKYDPSKNYRTSLVITEVADEPGALSNILKELAERNINLTSIMSRPTKDKLGKYHFFMDIDGHAKENETVKEAIETIKKKNEVKILGSYPKAN